MSLVLRKFQNQGPTSGLRDFSLGEGPAAAFSAQILFDGSLEIRRAPPHAVTAISGL
jgi:hypothetical protein